MTAALLLGGGLGASLFLLARALLPARSSLADAVARLESRPVPLAGSAVGEDEWSAAAARLGRRLAGMLGAIGVRPKTKEVDLAVVGRSAERHVADKCLLGVAGLVVGPLVAVAGVSIGLNLTLPGAGLSLLFGLGGFVAPDVALAAEAERRRRDFRHSFSAYLDWVTIVLAGGGGVDAALTTAATEGDNWAFARIEAALHSARSHAEPSWKGLEALGAQLDLPAAAELARTMRLAEMEGARVRASLVTKARALREHALTDAEAAARSATSKMAWPVVLMFLGFVVFIGYPALSSILAGPG